MTMPLEDETYQMNRSVSTFSTPLHRDWLVVEALFLFKTISDPCSLSYRNHSIDLHCKSIDWFLYDGEHGSLMG